MSVSNKTILWLVVILLVVVVFCMWNKKQENSGNLNSGNLDSGNNSCCGQNESPRANTDPNIPFTTACYPRGDIFAVQGPLLIVNYYC